MISNKGVKRYGPVATKNNRGRPLERRVRKLRKGNVPIEKLTVKEAAKKRARNAIDKPYKGFKNPYAYARSRVDIARIKAAAKKRASMNKTRMVVSPGGKIYKNPYAFARSRRVGGVKRVVLPPGFKLYMNQSPLAAAKAKDARASRKAKMRSLARKAPSPNRPNVQSLIAQFTNTTTSPATIKIPSVKNLLRKGFVSEKVARRVVGAMKSSEAKGGMVRPWSHYSKTTGKVRADAPKI